jgi:serine/threonine protein kinase
MGRVGLVSAELREGQTFGGYHIVELVGSGGMGLVYRAEQQILGRTVALKVIRPEIAESGDYRSRFLREAQLAARVDDPHVVSVYDFGEQDGRLYLTMQWINGVNLGTLIDRQGRLPPERAVSIGVQLAEALQAVHAAGLVHRDVKPSNVLVRDIGGHDHAYLTDFGIAKAPGAADGLTRTGLMMGTPGFLAPEQIHGQPPGPRSDLYALGCVIFEALTGQRPFRADSDVAMHYAHANSPRPVASAVCPELGRRFDAFFARALAVDPEQRFPSARALADALQSAYAGRPGEPTPVPAGRDYRPLLQPTATSPPPPTPAASPAAPPAAARGGTRPPPARSSARGGTRPPARSSARASWALGFGQMVVIASGVVFLAAVTVLTGYVNNGTGAKSLWQATHGDLASPLYGRDFWIPAALAILALVLTAISAATRRRLIMIGTAAASLGLIGYTFYIPSVGRSPGFAPYGASYWLSLAAAVAMLIGALVAASARPPAARPPSRPGVTRQNARG